MEMHTRESLRRVHGIDVRERRASLPIPKMIVTGRRKRAWRVRHFYFAKIIVAGARAIVEAAGKFLILPIRHAVRSRNAIRQLMQMSDRQLHDIGVSRGEIKHLVRNGRLKVR